MTTATFSPSVHTTQRTDADNHTPNRASGPFQAVKVFMGTLFSVAVLGEYAEDAGVRRR
ncbi:hypothetical protein [Streptomyces yaizuensis]|uniref:Uncharacterized protein n=1 Tax=Streptomyces yaizuensis TaxID=2989713 RepID=A0ABQ5P3W6_9ACTN|nr:hypothetical protein [Streptomyces sp. YSPA8]GLF97175.1 hypothetical protein SYYSPA8_22780 [Streptomyces sp. YSPA8]